MMALSGVRISWLILARKSDFADDACSAWRLALVSSSSACFHLVMSRNTAQNFRRVVGDAAHRHEQRDQPALALAADHLAAVVEHAGDAAVGEPVEIIRWRRAGFPARTVRRSCLAGELARLVAEQRLGAAVGRDDRAVTVDHHHAVGRGVEDRVELGAFGSRRRECGACRLLALLGRMVLCRALLCHPPSRSRASEAWASERRASELSAETSWATGTVSSANADLPAHGTRKSRPSALVFSSMLLEIVNGFSPPVSNDTAPGSTNRLSRPPASASAPTLSYPLQLRNG